MVPVEQFVKEFATRGPAAGSLLFSRQTLPAPATADIEASAMAIMAAEVSNLNRVWLEAVFTPIFVFEFIA
jgi:hypothetical protein